MSDSIQEHRIKKFAAGIDHLAQQKHTRLRPCVRVESDVKAKISFWDQIADSGEMTVKQARHAPTPNEEMDHRRRALTTKVYEKGALVDEADLDTVLNDPTGSYSQNMAMSAGRTQDDIIIVAADAVAKTGEDGDESVALPAGQIIGAGAVGMEIEKILKAKRILDGNEEDDMQRKAVATSAQFEDMLNEEKITSSDYAVVKALATGQINTYVGFDWVRSERLKIRTGADRKCLFFTMQSILFGVARDVTGRVDPRPDLSYDIQVYYKMTMGATRMNETGVVVVDCLES